MPAQEEHEKPENLVEAPGEAERAARTLQDAADSNATLEGYYAINDAKPAEQASAGAEEDKRQTEDRGKGHPVP